MVRVIVLFGILLPFAAYAVCDAGYYMNDGECVKCNPGSIPYYCPGDDMRYPCPKTDTDYSQFGYIPEGGNEGQWAIIGARSASSCMCALFFRDNHGNKFFLEDSFNGDNYWGDRKLWYYVSSGYYLSDYSWTSFNVWYRAIKECTNAPEHAHYTGAGTPDAPDGSVIDANDCPWECDDGYGLHDGVCVPLCTSGVRHIKTGTGLIFNLYPLVYSTPALVVKYNNSTCYGILGGGSSQNSININIGSEIYHMEN